MGLAAPVDSYDKGMGVSPNPGQEAGAIAPTVVRIEYTHAPTGKKSGLWDLVNGTAIKLADDTEQLAALHS